MSFELTTLGKYARVQGGFAYKSKDFSAHGTCPVLKIKNVRFGHVDYSEAAFIDNKLAQETVDWETKEGDILISMTGSGPNAPQSLVGRVARVWKDEPRAWINQRVGRLQLKSKGSIHTDFLFYLLSLPRSQEYFVSNSSGSANQANISGKIIESLPCPEVNYEQSAAIAKVLKKMDEKVLINRQINQTLEQMAEAIFKSWFVDFEPVKAKIDAKQNGQDPERAAMHAISGKSDEELDQAPPDQLAQLTATAALFPDELVDSEFGLIPEGWKWQSLNKVVELNPKRILKKGSVAPYLDMKNMPTQGHFARAWRHRAMGSGTKFRNGDTLMARITPCLENGKTAFVDFLDEGEIGWGSTEYIVMRSKPPLPVEYSYLLARDNTFRSFAIQNMTGTSGRQRVNAKSLGDFQVAVTDVKTVYNVFSILVKKCMAQIKCNGEQNDTLSQIRDTLLPKLLSGEISINKAQTKIREAI